MYHNAQKAHMHINISHMQQVISYMHFIRQKTEQSTSIKDLNAIVFLLAINKTLSKPQRAELYAHVQKAQKRISESQ